MYLSPLLLFLFNWEFWGGGGGEGIFIFSWIQELLFFEYQFFIKLE